MSRLPHLSAAPFLIGIALVAIAYLGVSTTRYVIHNYQLHAEERGLRAELQGLDRDHEQLSTVRAYLKSDEYVEYIARSILGLVRPGETLVIVSGTGGTPTAAAGETTPGAPWWKELYGSSASQAAPGTPTPSR